LDYFGKESFRELLRSDGTPAVSIYIPTERASTGWEANRLRFRAALGQARALLVEDYAPAEYKQLLDGLAPLLDDQDYWLYQADGLALFTSPGLERRYRLPIPLEEIVVVGQSFHTSPLLELLQTPERYWLLAVSQKEVRLKQGTARGLTSVDLRGVPKSLMEALGSQVQQDTLSHRASGYGSPVFHGYGVGKDDSKTELERFFRQIDSGLRDLLGDDLSPLLLAAVDYYHPIYRTVSRLDNLTADGIQGNVSAWSDERLHEAAWPIVEREAERKLGLASDLWDAAFKQKKTETDLSAAGRLAVGGRIRLLLTERGRRLWGRIDRTVGTVDFVREAGDDPGDHAVELLDELAEMVILRGGNALVVSPERMPTDTGVAAVLR
jgi:hypothetical protein